MHAGVLLRGFVVVDAHEEHVACIFRYLRRIILSLYLGDGSIGGVVELQFYDERRLPDMAARNHDEVGVALARGIFAVDNVFIARPNVGDGQHAGERVLIVIGENARVFIMRTVDGPCHCLFIASNGGFEKILRGCNGIHESRP